ncbi:unnamed protein product [Umbelopsis ramanniana]
MTESAATRRGSGAGISSMSPSGNSQATVTRSSSAKSKRGASHQRKSSLTYSPSVTTPESLNTPPLDTILEGFNGYGFGSSKHNGDSYFGEVTKDQQWSARRVLKRAQSYVNKFTQPTTPLLPQDKKHPSSAFGGSRKRKGVSKILQSRWIRFLIIFYTSFSVLLTFSHMWAWTFKSSKPQKVYINEDWEPKRTYDPDSPFSHLDNMSNTLKFSKVFSNSAFAIENIQPYYFRATSTPLPEDISLITHITVASWPQLERLAENWQAPISATLHIQSKSSPLPPDIADILRDLGTKYRSNIAMSSHVDIHLYFSPPASSPSLALAHNVDRNLARLYARTEFICDVPAGIIPATRIRNTLRTNQKSFLPRLRDGDVMVVPLFTFIEHAAKHSAVPRTKTSLLSLVSKGVIGLDDKHWELGSGPTNFERWKDSETVYAVKDYEVHYEPIVIQSRNAQPWCPERFADNEAACLFASYLNGADFWVLPDDFMIQLEPKRGNDLSNFESVIQNRLYAKSHGEMCVHFARQLDSLGLWNTPKAKNAIAQCSRVISSWGKGLIGKPE